MKHRSSAGNLGYSAYSSTVSDVSHTKILLQGYADMTNYGPNWYENPHIEIGGMSGAPAYVHARTGGLELAGFVQAGRGSGENIYLSKASFLHQDGTLRRA